MFRRICTLLWLSILVSACSSSPANTQAPVQIGTLSSTESAATRTEAVPAINTATESATNSATVVVETTAPPVEGENCGEIVMLGPNPPLDSNAGQTESCFWRAFQQCQIATMTVTMRGVDAGAIHKFTVQKDGNCSITDNMETYAAVSPERPTSVFSCTGLVQQDGGLLFLSCGDQGDIFVPAPQSS